MNKVALPLLFLLALSACGSSARNEAAEAGSTITADPNATMAEAVKDVDAAGIGEAARTRKSQQKRAAQVSNRFLQH